MLQSICVYYSLDESQLLPETKHELLPKEIRHARAMLHTTNQKIIIYSDEDLKPLWFKFESSGILIPTMLTLWRCPYLAKGRIIYTPLHVLEIIQGGADLMIPGCFAPYPDLHKGDVVVYCSIPEQIPIGVGLVLVSETKSLERSMKGKAAQTVHTLGDTLVSAYKNELAITPELAFDYSLPYGAQAEDLTTKVAELSTEDQEQAEESEQNQQNGEENFEKKQPEEQSAGDELDQEQVQEQTEIQESTEDAESDGEGEKLSTAEVDEVFKTALLQTVFKSIDDGAIIQTPISASQLLGSHVLVNLPLTPLQQQHLQLSIKKTSWKKATKFFKAMEKEGLLKTKDHKDDLMIVSLAGLEHPLLQKYEPYEVVKKKKTGPSQPTTPKSDGQLVAIELWKPHSAAVPFFNVCAAKAPEKFSGGLYYDTDGLKIRLVWYINQQKLVNPKDKKTIIADDILVGAFGLPKQAALNDALRVVGRDKIVTMLQKQCTPFHIIYDPKDPVLQQFKDAKGALAAEDVARALKPAKGGVPHIVVATERRGGNKTVTTVTGLEAFGIDAVDFAEELRKACAGSTSVNNVKQGANEIKSVLVQGPQVKAVETSLQKRGVRPTWITVNDKVGGGKKGKK